MIDPENYKGRRDNDDDDDRDDEIDDGRETDALGLDELLASYAEPGGYVFLRRHELGEWTFLAKVQIADANLDQIQARFGGGKYRAEIIGENGRRWKQRTFRIAGRSKSGDDDEPKSDSEQRIERLEAMLAEREAKPANGETVGIADVLKVALTALTTKPTVDPLMTTLITALVGNNKKSGDGVDPLELQKLLQAAEDRGYARGKELGEAIAGIDGGGDGVARVLASNLPGVIDAFKSAKQSYDRNVAPRPVPQATAQVAGPTDAPIPESVPTTEGEAMGLGLIGALRPAVPHIVKWARDGKDAQIKAANTVDDLSDSIRDAIAVQAEEPEFVSSIVAAIPEFQAPGVQEWVTVFLTTVQDILTAPDEPEVGAGTVTTA